MDCNSLTLFASKAIIAQAEPDSIPVQSFQNGPDITAALSAPRLREAIDEFVHNAIRRNENGERGSNAAALQHD
jgi:hypothetical protein